MFHVSVALLSGQRAIWASVGDLRVLAQKSFHHGVLKLLGGDHAVVDPAASLQAAGLKDGDHLTLIAIECHRGKAGSSTTGLLWRWPGCYMGHHGAIWGSRDHSGDSQSTLSAFAAIFQDGSVVTWGNPRGGDTSGSLESKISWKVPSRFKQLEERFLRSWRTDRFWLGAIQTLVVTAQQLQISFQLVCICVARLAQSRPAVEGVPNSERANFGCPYSCDFVCVQVCMCVEYICMRTGLIQSYSSNGPIVRFVRLLFGFLFGFEGPQGPESWCILVSWRQDFDALVFGAPKLLRNLHHGSASPQLPLVQVGYVGGFSLPIRFFPHLPGEGL